MIAYSVRSFIDVHGGRLPPDTFGGTRAGAVRVSELETLGIDSPRSDARPARKSAQAEGPVTVNVAPF